MAPTLRLTALFFATLPVLAANPAPATAGAVAHAEPIQLRTPAYGQSVEAGGTAVYELRVGNPTDQPQVLTLSPEAQGYGAMTPAIEPRTLELAPGEVKTATLRVTVPDRVPPGGHEKQTLRLFRNGTPLPAVEFITASRLPHPNILHTAEGWNEVRAKVKNHGWAQKAQADYLAKAERWDVPEVQNKENPGRGDWLFHTEVELDLMAAGISYQLTSDPKFAGKVRTFLLRLSDPANGYPVTRRACHQASVQEGHFFQHLAMAYDMALPSGVFSEADRRQIDATLRLFVDSDPGLGGQISNWNVSSLTGGLYCALVLQDLAAADRFLHAHGGIIDQLRAGTLDDGWWYELSISYNTWVASEFSQAALALRPWGMDLANMRFAPSYRPENQRIPEKSDYGATDAKWGPIHHNWIGIKRMWDVLPSMVDYRGVMFGLNDSTERKVTGQAMELAYYLYRDPAHATVIKRGGDARDLIYGVPELPENTPDLSTRSTYADNAGVAVLRSTADGKPARERIQAVLTYGDHGWYHGHFDTVSLGHLSRYGRSFFNPEMVWYGYGSYLYKFYVETSVSKNMVVVDQKMQEPTENRRLLFHSGPMMQAAAVGVTARWSNPPYGGIVYDEKKTFAGQALGEGRSIPIPPEPPPYQKIGSLTGYTEPIEQRRLMIVTDDYVVLADSLKGEREHTFDALFQMKGVQGLEAADKKLVRHTGQWNPDPVGSAQFMTGCDWYSASAPARGSYRFLWGEGADNSGTRTECNEPGVLNLDVHTLWPPKQEIMIGTVPETHPVQRIVDYAVRADGRALAEGKSGMWILGEQTIDVPLEGAESLELETRTGTTQPGTLFWANARLVTADGREMPLSDLDRPADSHLRVVSANAAQPGQLGKDFEGGPIKIAGIPYERALSAQPQDGGKPAIVRVDLRGLNAVRFKTVLGGDFPVGDESQRRKTVAVRSQGKEARFLTVIEPFEDKRVVARAIARDADTLRVELRDGRVHDFQISHLPEGDGNNVAVRMTETKNGATLRTETTTATTR